MIKTSEKIPVYDSAELVSPFVEEIKGLKSHWFVLRRMIHTNFKIRYKRSYLGIVWSLLNPLLNMLVYVIVFSSLFNRVEHYALYVLCGNMIFKFFSTSTKESMVQIIRSATMIRRVFIPKTIYVLAGIGINGVDLILTFIPFLLIAVFDRLNFSFNIFLIIPALILCSAFVIGISLIVATITPFVNDFSQLWSVILTLWQYLTPIFYPIDIIPEKLLFFYKLNPLYIYVTLFRDSVLNPSGTHPVLWIAGTIYGVVFLIIGWWLFTKNSNEFAYRA